jgi:hypothetical protein
VVAETAFIGSRTGSSELFLMAVNQQIGITPDRAQRLLKIVGSNVMVFHELWNLGVDRRQRGDLTLRPDVATRLKREFSS